MPHAIFSADGRHVAPGDKKMFVHRNSESIMLLATWHGLVRLGFWPHRASRSQSVRWTCCLGHPEMKNKTDDQAYSVTDLHLDRDIVNFVYSTSRRLGSRTQVQPIPQVRQTTLKGLRLPAALHHVCTRSCYVVC